MKGGRRDLSSPREKELDPIYFLKKEGSIFSRGGLEKRGLLSIGEGRILSLPCSKLALKREGEGATPFLRKESTGKNPASTREKRALVNQHQKDSFSLGTIVPRKENLHFSLQEEEGGKKQSFFR